MVKVATTFALCVLLLAASPSAARRSLLQSADAPVAGGEHAGQHARGGPHLPPRDQKDQKQEDDGLGAFGDFLAQGFEILAAVLNATANLDAQAAAGPGGVGAGVRMGAGAGPFAAGAAGSAGAAANGTAMGAGAAGRAGAVALPGIFNMRPGAGFTKVNASEYPELEKLGKSINDTLAGLGNALTTAVSAIFPGLDINNTGGAPLPGSSNCDETDASAALINPGPNGARPSGRPSLIIPDGNGPVPDGSGVRGSNIERLSSVASGAGERAARLLLSSAGAAVVLLLVA